jgi:hypothetical protein
VYVDEGPVLKRWRARARGRAARIKKPTCHITVKLTPMERAPEPAPPPEPEPEAKAETPKKKAAPRKKAPAAKKTEEAEA